MNTPKPTYEQVAATRQMVRRHLNGPFVNVLDEARIDGHDIPTVITVIMQETAYKVMLLCLLAGIKDGGEVALLSNLTMDFGNYLYTSLESGREAFKEIHQELEGADNDNR